MPSTYLGLISIFSPAIPEPSSLDFIEQVREQVYVPLHLCPILWTCPLT